MAQITQGTVANLGLAGQWLWVSVGNRTLRALATTNISSRRVTVMIDDRGKVTISDPNAARPVLSPRTERFHQGQRRKPEEDLFLVPQYWGAGLHYADKEIVLTLGDPAPYAPPKANNVVHYVAGQKATAITSPSNPLWWAADGFAAFYLDGIFIYTALDNEGWAKAGEIEGVEPWNGDISTRWGIPVVFSKDGIKWDTPAKSGNFFDIVEEGLSESERVDIATPLFFVGGTICAWSNDYSTLYLRTSQTADLYLARTNQNNLLGYGSLGSFYWYSLDKGKTWASGITSENQLGYYNYAFSVPAFAGNSVYTGVIDRIKPSLSVSPSGLLLPTSGLVEGSTQIVLRTSNRANIAMVGFYFEFYYTDTTYSGQTYQITGISEDGRTITFTPPIEDTDKVLSRVSFPAFIRKDSIITLGQGNTSVLTRHSLSSNAVSVPVLWPVPEALQERRHLGIQHFFAIDYQPLDDDFLEVFHGATDPHFAPLDLYAQTMQWEGRGIAIGLLYGDHWLCPFTVNTTDRIPADSSIPVWPPFSEDPYANIYRPIGTSEKYRLKALSVEDILGSSPLVHPKRLIGTWNSTSDTSLAFPEEIMPDAVVDIGGYWNAVYAPLFSYPTDIVQSAGNSVFLVLRMISLSSGKQALFLTLDSLSYSLVPNSELTGLNVLGYTHDGAVDTEYGFIWYNPILDTVNVAYGAISGGVAYLFHAASSNGIGWETTRREQIQDITHGRFIRPFLGDKIPSTLKKQGTISGSIL